MAENIDWSTLSDPLPPYVRTLRDAAAINALSWLGAEKALEQANELMRLLGYDVPGETK